jgi:hypothetical protein
MGVFSIECTFAHLVSLVLIPYLVTRQVVYSQVVSICQPDSGALISPCHRKWISESPNP